jgi:putative NADH-flavin reductase
MRLTIFGATGGIGRGILEQALREGHDVTAVARDPGKVTAHARVAAIDLSAPDRASLEASVAGADAVLSALGPRSRSDAGIASKGTRAIVDAMQVTGARRIVVVSAAPIGTVPSPDRPAPPKHDPGDGFFMRHRSREPSSASTMPISP